MSVPSVRFDDVEAICGFISDEFGEWGPQIEITQDMIDQFADLTGDDQWIHTDVERCRRESPFGGPIAHGFLTLSLLGAIRPPARFALTDYKAVVNYGSSKMRFLDPVPAGSTIHARRRLVSAAAHPKGTRVEAEVAIHVVGRERPSLLYRGIALYR